MFAGLSAFPLTPFRDDAVDEVAFAGLIQRLASAAVDSITVLGSTGSYAYLTRAERRRVAELAIEHAGKTPVVVGIGALRTKWVLESAQDAQAAGAAGVLLAPVSYQALTDEDVYGLFEDVTASLSVPLVVYDNPGTTHFRFTDDLYAAVATLPNVASIKIPGVPADPDEARERISTLRHLLPERISIGVSGDASAARGLLAGCEAWYSVIGGTLPDLALELTRSAQAADEARAEDLSERLRPLWELFARHGSLRVVAAIAEHLGLVAHPSLPRPIRGLDDADRIAVQRVVDDLGRAG